MGWFYLWIIVSAPAAYVSCQDLTTSLPEDTDACTRNEVTFTCTIRGSPNLTSLILAWSSSEYIGQNFPLLFTSANMVGANKTSVINGNVTATLTSNTVIGGAVRVPVLVSKLHIVGANQDSMITCRSLTDGSSISTMFDGSAFPSIPQNVLARQLSADSCEILVAWDPLSNFDRYIVYVPSRNIAAVEISTTSVLNIQRCRDDDVRIQVAAVNRFGCVGLNSTQVSITTVEMATASDQDIDAVSTGVAIGVAVTVTLMVTTVVMVSVLIVCNYYLQRTYVRRVRP